MKDLLRLFLPVFFIIFFIQLKTDSQSTRMKDKFYLGMFNYSFDPEFYGSAHLNNYSLLSLNMMQGYGTPADHDPLSGGFYDALEVYRGSVNNMLGAFKNSLNENSMLISRSKITRPAYGQSSKYQLEYLPARRKNLKDKYR